MLSVDCGGTRAEAGDLLGCPGLRVRDDGGLVLSVNMAVVRHMLIHGMF